DAPSQHAVELPQAQAPTLFLPAGGLRRRNGTDACRRPPRAAFPDIQLFHQRVPGFARGAASQPLDAHFTALLADVTASTGGQRDRLPVKSEKCGVASIIASGGS